RGTEKMVNVAYMTFASEFFSWYAGSVKADTYFCPERHGTYFGGFYMKDMPAMGKRDFDISTSVTGDSGKEFLNILTEDQRKNITAIPDLQRKALQEIISVRGAISKELRKFLSGGQADKKTVLALGRRYGELDGEMSYCYAAAFAKANRTLTADQRQALVKLRNLDGYTSAPAYIYSDPVNGPVNLPSTDSFFFPPTS
ncbi:MAG: Spy/CpxP family protein refolding chaperone, partial [Verrucomicrobiota bacterium]